MEARAGAQCSSVNSSVWLAAITLSSYVLEACVPTEANVGDALVAVAFAPSKACPSPSASSMPGAANTKAMVLRTPLWSVAKNPAGAPATTLPTFRARHISTSVVAGPVNGHGGLFAASQDALKMGASGATDCVAGWVVPNKMAADCGTGAIWGLGPSPFIGFGLGVATRTGFIRSRTTA